MNKMTLGLAALTLFAAPAFAQAPLNFADVDTDASGELSFAELQAVWPDITQDEFNAVDLDMNGSLSADELTGLQPSTLPAPATAPMDDTLSSPSTPESLLETED